MNTLLNLKELSVRLAKVDTMLMSLLKRRMDLALQVGEFKIANRQKIFRAKIENKRLVQVRTWARKNKMNPHFVEAILYMIIGESCKQQMIQLQSATNNRKKNGFGNEQEWRKLLDRNLLVLTEWWSKTYDTDYDKAFFATHAYLEFENELLEQEIAKLPNRDTFLDLGCATGRLTFQFADKFLRTVGYDISSHMIEKANKKAVGSGTKNICFKVADIQNGIPELDKSVSLAVMNLGTASDVRDLPKVLKEITRVLKTHGRFFLSFYNLEALLYRWDFIPWPTGLVAEINVVKHCLDVHFNNKVLSIHARPYSVDEVLGIVKGGITISGVQTYPTVSAILPNDLFENQPDIQKSIIAMDKHLTTSNGGAYIVVTGKKVG